jgi:maltokinase
MTRTAVPCPAAELRDFVAEQRWFGGKELELVGAEILDRADLGDGVTFLLVETRYGSGSHDLYQLLAREGPGAVATFDALNDPAAIVRLAELAAAGATVSSQLGTLELCSLGALPSGELTPLGAEQSNSSVVVGGELLVKLYRRLEPGLNPELELLRFLSDRQIPSVPTLLGWWGYTGPVLETTLGIFQRFLAGTKDGWSVSLELLESDPAGFVVEAGRLGGVVGALHAVLASETEDAAFAPEQPKPEAIPLLTATVDDEIAQLFDHLPEDDAVASIAGLGGTMRDLLGSVATAGPAGRLIRLHGDLHLGQLLRAGDDWFVVDFEGEPARSVPERRAKRSPLRDVAGMLRSFAYATIVAGRDDDGTEDRARAAFLHAYLAVVDDLAIVPPSPQLERLLQAFELEKLAYELRYELSHRPEWVHIPVTGIGRLLERSPA